MSEGNKVKNVLQKYMQWPLILSVLMICANAAVGIVSARAGLIMVVFTVLYLVCAGWLFWSSKKKVQAGLVSYAADYGWSQKQLLTSMELPYGIADTDGRILWMNRAMTEIFGEEKASRRTLPFLFEEITAESLKKMEHSIEVTDSYGDSIYRISIRRVNVGASAEFLGPNEDGDLNDQILAVYMYDETELHGYIQAFTEQKMVAGLIYLDNYEEALESVEDVRRSLLVALIDRKVSKYISGLTGIVKKMEKDKYFFAIKQKYMAKLEEDRFGLL